MKKTKLKKVKIDLSQFMLNDADKKQMRSLDNVTIRNDPNYKTNKRINLEYYDEDETDEDIY